VFWQEPGGRPPPPWQRTVVPPPPVSRTTPPWAYAASGVVLFLVLVAAVVGSQGGEGDVDAGGGGEATRASADIPGEQSVEGAPTAEDPPAEPAPEQPPADPALLRAADGGDGDSWKDTVGREYRLGLVNTPERGECFSAEATAERKRLVAGGFRAEVYSIDRYGRSVAVVTSAEGASVNVHLARNGFADDRYVEQFRHENAALAAELGAAFRVAKAEGAGLWGRCRGSGSDAAPAPAAPPAAAPAPAPPPAAAAAARCHPAYVTCIAVKGDGSGRRDANDLDCPTIGKRVQLKVIGVDPYRLDADSDGWGCESHG